MMQHDLINAVIDQVVRPEGCTSSESAEGGQHAAELARSRDVVRGNFGGRASTRMIGSIPADARGAKPEEHRLHREWDEAASPTQDDGDKK
jgi:hypothetical protein